MYTVHPRSRRARLLSAAISVGLLGATSAAQAGALSGNVSPWVATAPRTGTAPDSRTVTIAVHMRLKDLAGLERLAADVSRPSSPLYGHYLSNAELRGRFAPDATDVSAVQTMLAAAGMTNIKAGPLGAYVSATATVGQLRATFGVSQDLYTYAGRTLRANREAPTVPDALVSKIVAIEGIDDSTSLKHPNHTTVDGVVAHAAPAATTRAATASAVTPPPVAANAPSPYCSTYFGTLQATLSTKPNPYGASLPWNGCGYTPQQIQAAYGIDKVSQKGTGITIAFTDAYASPTLLSDANQYAANHGLPALTSANFTANFPPSVLSANPADTCGPYGWWEEQSLDIAAIHGTAPGANILYVGALDCDTSLSVALVDTIYQNAANVISNSWSYSGESQPSAQATTFHQAFVAAAAQGITVLFSSGDSGDLSQNNGFASASGPGDDAYATSVGGTSLLLRSADGTKAEYGWGNYRDYLGNALVNSSASISTTGPLTTTVNGVNYQAYAFYLGAGGGISLFQPQPSYQVGVVPVALATTVNDADGQSGTTTGPHRVLPDVSMDADPYTGYLFGETFTIAGNSYSDAGCTPTGATTEYCEEDVGGTSLASPLLAGVIGLLDEARAGAGKPAAGFVNPLFYSLKLGTNLGASALNDVTAPSTPTAVLRGYQNDLTRVRVVTINSVPDLAVTTPYPLQICADKVCEGLVDVFNHTTTGYDDVTGLGVPFVPKLIKR